MADSHRNVLHNVMRYTNNLGIDRRDRLSLIQSASFSGTVSSLFSALLNGATLFPFDLQRRGIAGMARWLRREEITIFHSVPAIFEQLLGVSQSFPSLRIVRLEGDRTHKRHVALFEKHFNQGCVLANGLGTTETGLIRQFFINGGRNLAVGSVPVGAAVPDMEVSLLGPGRSRVPSGAVGDISVSSRYLAQGYWRCPDLTAAAFEPDPDDLQRRVYRTGDLGRMLPRDCLEFLGRKAFQVKVRGLRVETAEIEDALDELPEIAQALVLAREDRPGVQQLVAYLVSAVEPPPTVSRLREALGRRLPVPMIPARYVFLDQLPTDRNRKFQRRALPPPGRSRPQLDRPWIEPKDSVERAIAACFREVLDLDSVGLHDDFFELGGDSLLATRLLYAMEERLGKPCPLHFFLEGPNVAHIRSRFDREAKAGVLVPIKLGGTRPPLFFLHGVSGHVLEYYQLSRLLGGDQPVFGLQNPDLIDGKNGLARVETMAAAYVSAIQNSYPEGPYYLCGDCFGGTLAFEVAQQLVHRGREVALLALIDTAYPGGAWGRLPARLADPGHWQRLKQLPWKDAVEYIMGKVRGLGRWAPELRYRPKPYPGRVVLICAGPPHNQVGWKRVATGGLTIVELQRVTPHQRTPHLTREPYVGALARTLEEQIAALSTLTQT